jgi:parvulin-like peptidyl-prolyl isomerase
VRHLLVNWKLPEDAAADQTPNDGEKEMTRLQAESYLNEYLGGEQTEENFATLATRVSEDTGSQSTGGLYENIYKGQMVLPFEEWCFDPARKAGDTGLVETTYGYHVMYYVGPGETRWKNQIKTTLENEHSSALTTDLETNVTSNPNAFGLFFSGGM